MSSKWNIVPFYQRWFRARDLSVAETTDNGKEDERELVKMLSVAREWQMSWEEIL